MGSRPTLDEESFTRLLAAAYVLQQHRERSAGKLPPSDFTQITSEVVETQHLVQSGELGFQPALDLIVARLQKISGAAGAAISLLDAGKLFYKAGSGSAANLIGSTSLEVSGLSYHCLKTGGNVRSPVAEADPRVDRAFRQRVGARSLLAVPICYEGKTAGVLELFFSEIESFDEGNVHACELMAGLASEVIAQAAQQQLRQEVAAERTSVLVALEKLKPQLQKLAGELETVKTTDGAIEEESKLCRACGHYFVDNESFCGVCGASRTTGKYPGSELQDKWAALLKRQFAQGKEERRETPVFGKTAVEPASESEETVLNVLGELPTVTGDEVVNREIEADTLGSQFDEKDVDVEAALQTAEPRLEKGQTSHLRWSSSVHARDWLNAHLDLSSAIGRLQRWAIGHTGDISLALAALVFVLVLIWGLRPNPTPKAISPTDSHLIAQVGRKRKTPQPQLGLFETLMVKLGLAVPPPAPADMGNPNTTVWVDLHTALYYCAGSDLYGTTPKGKFTTQGDAQQDHYEPAYRKPCD